MTNALVTNVRQLSVILVAAVGLNCALPDNEESTETIHAALTATDPVPCAARAAAVIANTSNVVIGRGTLVDSYQSSLGAYGGSNVGSAAVVQAATTIANNGGVVRGTLRPNTPAGLAVVPVPPGARNLPLGSTTPGSLNINTAAQSITLAPGNYVAANITVNAPGAIRIAPAGEVRIWVTGTLNLGGNLNVNGIPKNLAFLVTSSGSVNINGGGAFYGLLYAPTSVVIVNGPVFGSVIGRSVTLNTGAAVHFDQSSTCAPPQTARLDQSFTTPTDLSAGLYGLPASEAQSYTAGISGTLQGVALDVTAQDPTLVARIRIESVSGGIPTNVVLRASAGERRRQPVHQHGHPVFDAHPAGRRPAVRHPRGLSGGASVPGRHLRDGGLEWRDRQRVSGGDPVVELRRRRDLAILRERRVRRPLPDVRDPELIARASL